MESVHVRKIAKILNILVLIALIFNIIVLYLVPVAVISEELSDGGGLLAGVAAYLGDFLHPGEDDIVKAAGGEGGPLWKRNLSSPRPHRPQRPSSPKLTLPRF